MKKIIFTLVYAAFFLLFSCSQPKTVLKDADSSPPTEISTKESTNSNSSTKQEFVIGLYEATHKVKLSAEEKASVLSSSNENLLAWQKVLENYSGNSSVDLDYLQKLISGMKSKL